MITPAPLRVPDGGRVAAMGRQLRLQAWQTHGHLSLVNARLLGEWMFGGRFLGPLILWVNSQILSELISCVKSRLLIDILTVYFKNVYNLYFSVYDNSRLLNDIFEFLGEYIRTPHPQSGHRETSR
jgi:hypothetical protein